MSGGAHDYLYHKIESECVGSMHDLELDDLMKDIASLLHAWEWYDSRDRSEEDYRKAVRKFKAKWFCESRDARLKEYIDFEINKVREDCHKLIDWGCN